MTQDPQIPDDGIVLECASCGFDEITPADVEPEGDGAVNIDCPECGATTMRRLANTVADPETLDRILGL